MEKRSELKEISYRFSVNVVKMCRLIKNKEKEHNMTNQLIRSGTSIGANIMEANYAQSKKDFISKMYISLKEAKESEYWIRLLKDTDYIKNEEHQYLNKDLQSVIRMLIASIKTMKKQLEKQK